MVKIIGCMFPSHQLINLLYCCDRPSNRDGDRGDVMQKYISNLRNKYVCMLCTYLTWLAYCFLFLSVFFPYDFNCWSTTCVCNWDIHRILSALHRRCAIGRYNNWLPACRIWCTAPGSSFGSVRPCFVANFVVPHRISPITALLVMRNT